MNNSTLGTEALIISSYKAQYFTPIITNINNTINTTNTIKTTDFFSVVCFYGSATNHLELGIWVVDLVQNKFNTSTLFK